MGNRYGVPLLNNCNTFLTLRVAGQGADPALAAEDDARRGRQIPGHDEGRTGFLEADPAPGPRGPAHRRPPGGVDGRQGVPQAGETTARPAAVMGTFHGV